MIQHSNQSPPPYGGGGWGGEAFFTDQLTSWHLARTNYEALKNVQVKALEVEGMPFKVQFNPARILSSSAKTDAQSIRERPCFLCAKNRPEEQKGIPFGGHYQILVNPFPIFPRHLTIVEEEHLPQRIASRFPDMLDLAKALTDYTLFYNGPQCGASAPDHAHFQAGSRGFLPIETMREEQLPHALVIRTADRESAIRQFRFIYNALPMKADEVEPMMNILALYKQEEWVVFIFPRAKHRPVCYHAEGDARLLTSPASVDLGGVFILPVEVDFQKISADDIRQTIHEVCLPAEEIEQIKEQLKSHFP